MMRIEKIKSCIWMTLACLYFFIFCPNTSEISKTSLNLKKPEQIVFNDPATFKRVHKLPFQLLREKLAKKNKNNKTPQMDTTNLKCLKKYHKQCYFEFGKSTL